MEQAKIVYDDIVWVKQENGYYEATHKTKKLKGKKGWLHQYIYEKYKGKQPKGYSAHHIDLNKENNSIDNLELISKKEHSSFHSTLYFKNEDNYQRQLEHLNRIRPDHVWPEDKEKREEFRQNLIKSMNNIELIDKVCDYCGKEYKVSPLGNSRFCSNKCKSAWRRKSGLDNIIRECPICGKSFSISKYESTITCSRSCGDILRGRTINEPGYKESKNKIN